MRLISVALCVLLGACSQQQPRPYSVVVDKDGNVWKVDTGTGELWRCWQGTPGVVSPQCYKAVDR